jgi:RNA polymerase sigma-70 factor (ECF subfamily)
MYLSGFRLDPPTPTQTPKILELSSRSRVSIAMNRSEERTLIERAIAGDRAAAEAFIRAHQASLYAYMLRMSGKPDVAEDIVQDAFVRALTNLDRFDFKFRFSTWLFTIAKRLYVNACQKHKPSYDSDVVGGWEGKGGKLERPYQPAIDTEVTNNAKAAIDYALACLNEEQREIVVLFHQLDWPICQIAEYMDMPEGTVKSHLHRGRMKMRSALVEHEQFSKHIEEVWT